ncbi:MAG: hypothetical protein IKW96_03350 [Ruminococcus sp.]|uniref:hypothetical protein n=1 Tax=Ruminococcus sp. TaxID=41978 RepID=UPI0025E43B38|nr:hypothetical protein [Ruminococcus sp.]MBR5682305.1 hypothetical protein [Ruminococcus sp.]
MNPMNVFKLKGLLDRFKDNHPKVPLFFKAAAGTVREGSVIEIKVISPENKTIVTNFRVNSEDIALVNELKDLV